MASIIPIDDSLNKTEEFSEFLLFTISEGSTDFLPKLSLQQILAAKIRPGLNPQILTAAVVSRFKEIGIPTGILANGTPNVMEAYTEALIEEIVDAIQTDMRVDVVIDPGAIVQATGANAGGPVYAIGATTSPHTGIGVPR